MPRGYRSNGLAFVLICLTVGGYPDSHDAYAQSSAAKDKGKPEKDLKPSSFGTIEDKLDGISSAIKANKAKPQSATERQQTKDDLEAQESMALWAKWMFIAAAITTLITGLGILLIWRTLIHTRRAAKYAGVAARQARKATIASEDMAKDASKSTKAAIDASSAAIEANKIAVIGQKNSLRAYVVIELETGNVSPDKEIIFNCTAINRGQTMAKNFAFAGCAIVRNADWKWDSDNVVSVSSGQLEKDVIEGAKQSITLHREQKIQVCMDMDGKTLPGEVYDNIKKGEACVFARGVGTYEDVFGDIHETHISIEFSGSECFRRSAPRMANEGNYST